MEHFSNNHKYHPNQHKNSHKLCDKNEAWPFEFHGKSMETETTTWSKFPDGEKAIVEQRLVLEEVNKSKKVGLWESQSVVQVGKLASWIRLFIKEFPRPISPTRIG